MFDLFSKNSEQYFCSVSSLLFCWMQKDGHIISGAADIYFSAENEIIPLQKALLHISGFLTERFSFVQELLTYAGAIVNNTLRHFSSFFHFDEYSQRLLFSNLSFKKKKVFFPHFLPLWLYLKGRRRWERSTWAFLDAAHTICTDTCRVCVRVQARVRLRASVFLEAEVQVVLEGG